MFILHIFVVTCILVRLNATLSVASIKGDIPKLQRYTHTPTSTLNMLSILMNQEAWHPLTISTH